MIFPLQLRKQRLRGIEENFHGHAASRLCKEEDSTASQKSRVNAIVKIRLRESPH